MKIILFVIISLVMDKIKSGLIRESDKRIVFTKELITFMEEKK